VSVRKLLLKALDENQHGLPSKRLSGTSFDFVVWKNESNQPHVSGRTLTLQLPFCFKVRTLSGRLVSSSPARPCDDTRGLNSLLSESDGDAADFLD